MDRSTSEILIFYANNNLTRETLLPIVKKMFIVILMKSIIMKIQHLRIKIMIINFATRIYNDCFSSYQINDFISAGYKLLKVNHSV